MWVSRRLVIISDLSHLQHLFEISEDFNWVKFLLVFYFKSLVRNEKEKYYKIFIINVIMTVIDEFQQLNLFVFELFFYVIGDMSVKSIIKFVVFLASLLKKSTNYLKNVIFL